jgi:hypothetical protein
MIEHRRHQEIDKAAWDARLLRCPNRLWYAQSWVLDRMCPAWEALIDADADAQMPLTARRKWGIDYLFQPIGLQQLGVFAAQPSDELHQAFVKAIPHRFRYIDIMLNATMRPGGDPGCTWEARRNQVIHADRPIERLRAGYAKGHQRNLKGASIGGEPEFNATDFEALFRRTTGARFGKSAVTSLEDLIGVIEEGMARGQCTVKALSIDGRPEAAACFANWGERSILLKSANTQAGYHAKAMFRITDAWIDEHAGSGMLLDFAGSSTPSVARFNAGFGAEERTYFRLRRNRLPLPLRWLKQ